MECTKCRRKFPLNSHAFRCMSCNEPIHVTYNYEELKNKISRELFSKRERSLWRYRELLPVTDESKTISLGEGGTPLIKSSNLAAELNMENLYFKDESRNPTGSFKDRGSSIGVSMALEIGAKIVGCTSTGNMAASLAAYAAKANLKCIILIPHGTPIGKILQTLIYEPTVLSVKLPYPELYKMMFEMALNHKVYLVHSDSPMRIEGQKTIAYEICEQLNWNPPDTVIVPVSSGGNITAIWKGFKELHLLGLIDELPRLVCVQSSGCAPIVKAFKEKQPIKPWPKPETIAHSISNPNPLLASGNQALKAINESKGLAVEVSDEEIIEAQKLLAKKEGLLVQPASATTIAALRKLIELNEVDRREIVVCILTGSGLKNMEVFGRKISRPLTVASWNEFREKLNALISGIT